MRASTLQDRSGVDAGRIETTNDLAFCMAIARKVTPAWCHRHDDFESVMDEVIAEALVDFDSNLGSFSPRLHEWARTRVPQELGRLDARARVPGEESVSLDAGDGEGLIEALGGNRNRLTIEQQVLGQIEVCSFIDALSLTEQRVVTLLDSGFTQVEIGHELRLHPRAVSRTVRRLRSKASAQFEGAPVLLTAA